MLEGLDQQWRALEARQTSRIHHDEFGFSGARRLGTDANSHRLTVGYRAFHLYVRYVRREIFHHSLRHDNQSVEASHTLDLQPILETAQARIGKDAGSGNHEVR